MRFPAIEFKETSYRIHLISRNDFLIDKIIRDIYETLH